MKQCIHCDRPAKQGKRVCTQGYYADQRYNLNCLEYNWKKFNQAFTCANPGCDNPAEHLDHHHDTGQVRDFLCSGCNKALGYLSEDAQRMAGLIQYLAKHETVS